MADGDFLDIQDQLASLVGAESISQLPEVEQKRIKKLINQAYREMYLGVDGRKPRWASKEYSLRIAAPLTATGTATKYGNKVDFTPGTLAGWGIVAGSVAKVGTVWYRVSHIDEDNSSVYLLDEYLGDTGDAEFTLYFSSFRLPAEAYSVNSTPELVGVGPLSPMDSAREELRYRASHVRDFVPAGAPFNRPTLTYSGGEFERGTPIWYHATNSVVEGAAEAQDVDVPVDTGIRVSIYPLPAQEYNLRIGANIIPATLTADDATFRLPANVVDDILLPIARAKLAMVDPRYNGNNGTFILRDLEEARARLRAISTPQRQKHASLTLRPRW